MSRRHRVPGTSSRPLEVVYLLPPIPDAASVAFKNMLAIRNVASTTGVCPDCGTRGELRGPDAHGFLHLVFEHEVDCAVLLDPEAA